LLSRRSAQRDLLEFTRRTFRVSGGDEYKAGPMHRTIERELCAAMDTPDSRVILEAPRRHGKSELSTKRFPAFYVGNHPKKQIICCSYGLDLAAGFGRDVRNIISSPEYQNIFPGVRISADSAAAGRWHTEQGGIYVAAGVGGPVAGRGSDLLLVDDPFKNRLEAESAVTRESVWDWFRSAAYPTLMPGGSIVVTSSRWHEDDLIGRLIEQQPDRWKVIKLPAIRDGQALDPARYPLPVLEEIRATIGEREWNAQYQQQPTPDEGAFFRREWIQWYRNRAELLQSPLAVYVASDFALTDDGGDYTVHLVVGVNPGGHWFVLDVWRGQVDALEAVDAGLALVRQWKPQIWFGERVSITKAIGPFLRKRMQETSTFVRIEEITPVHDKATRARPIQGRAQMGLVHLPEAAAFTPDLVSELLSFPLGKNDDQVDCLSLLGLGLDSIHSAGRPQRRPNYKPWSSEVVMGFVNEAEQAQHSGRYSGRNGHNGHNGTH
jgi:predicted phage terminase large subunit-like protein